MNKEKTANAKSIASRTAVGAAWVMLWRFATRGVGFLSTLILARLLVPEDFGLVTLAAAFAGSVDLLSWIGVQDMLVREAAPTREQYDTAFTLSVLRGLLTATVVVALAPLLGYFMKEPRLTPIILTLALGAAMAGLENVGIVDFRRDLRFDMEFKLMILPRVAGSIITVVSAVMLRSYWALIIGILASRALRVVYSYTVHPFRPRWGLAAWRGFLHFSLWTWAGAVVVVLRDRCDSVIIGRFLGTSQVGIYGIGQEIALLPVSEVLEPLGRALFSGFAVSDQTSGGSGEAFLRVVGLVALIIMPASVGISALATPMVILLLGPSWTGAIIIIQILALSGVLRVFGHVSATLLIALGKPQIPARVGLCGATARVGLLLVLVHQGGLIGAAVAVFLSILVEEVFFVAAITQQLHLRVTQLIAQVWRGFLASLIMSGVLVSTGLGWYAVATTATQSVIDIFVTALFGAATYAGSVLVLWIIASRPNGAEREICDAAMSVWRRTSLR